MNILGALNAGHGAKKIVDYLKKINPELASKINLALQSGHSIEKVLGYMTKGGNKIDKALGDAPSDNLYQTALSKINPAAKGMAKAGLLAGGLALGAGAASRAIGSAGALYPDEIVQTDEKGLEGPEEKLNLPYIEPKQIETPLLPKESQQQEQPRQPTAAEQFPEIKVLEEREKTITNLWDMANKGKVKVPNAPPGFMGYAKTLMRTGSIKDYDTFKNFYKWWTSSEEEQKRGNPLVEFETFRKQTSSWTDPQTQQKTQEASTPEPETMGNLALMPDGDFGEIEDVEGDYAKVRTQSGIIEKKIDELEELPIAQDSLYDAYENLKNAIPENLRSSVINFAGYDANANELAFRPHGGALYIYKDISPEFADQLKNQMFQAKTTGNNFYGAWSESEGSYFSGLSKLIRDLQKQYGGKGKEYSRKYETLVDFLGAPEAAKKAKMKADVEKRKAERAKKKGKK